MMARKIHPLHKEVADKLERLFPTGNLVRDEACGGTQRIPLFYNTEKSRATEYCNVDLILLKDNKVRAIFEIEESNVKPTQICGKFLTAALARYYIHEKSDDAPVAMHDHVVFIQVVDTTKIPKNSAKPKQWRALEKSIQSILPLPNSNIRHYALIRKDEIDGLAFLLQVMA